MGISTLDRTRRWIAHPLHLALVTGAVPFFIGALLADAAYARSFEIQWKNFASWLIAGALVFAGFALLWAIIDLIRTRGGRAALCALALAATFVIGFINAVAGSGTLVTFPTLLALGVPPVTANVSNNIGLVPGAVSAAWGWRGELSGQRRRLTRLATASVVGGLVGAALLIRHRLAKRKGDGS